MVRLGSCVIGKYGSIAASEKLSLTIDEWKGHNSFN